MTDYYAITYRGKDLEPAQRPPAQPGTARMPSDDQELHPVPALVQPWTHGVPPLRPSTRRGERRPTRGGRRYPEIFLAEHDDYAGEIALHFVNGNGGNVLGLRMADFLALQAVVTNPAKPVTGRQVAQHLRELLAERRAGDLDGMGEDVRAFSRILRLLEG